MIREIKNPTNIKLTESDTDGIWLHFESKGLKAGVAVSTLLYGDITSKTVQRWAREQLDKQKIAHRRFCLHPELDKDTLEELERLNNIIKNEPLPPVPSNEFLKEGQEERTAEPSTRPSPPVEGGY
jgi:hypothetical protein